MFSLTINSFMADFFTVVTSIFYCRNGNFLSVTLLLHLKSKKRIFSLIKFLRLVFIFIIKKRYNEHNQSHTFLKFFLKTSHHHN